MRGYLSTENILDLKSIRSGPSRLIIPITGGFIKGPGVEAEILPSGADWPLVCLRVPQPPSPIQRNNIKQANAILTPQLDPSISIAHLDVRAQGRMSNNHIIYVHYTGILKIDEAISKVLSGAADAKTTAFGEHQWFTAPEFETSDPALKWIEDAAWVGQGRVVVDERGSAVDYEIYRVTNGA